MSPTPRLSPKFKWGGVEGLEGQCPPGGGVRTVWGQSEPHGRSMCLEWRFLAARAGLPDGSKDGSGCEAPQSIRSALDQGW